MAEDLIVSALVSLYVFYVPTGRAYMLDFALHGALQKDLYTSHSVD
jgi:hypothetical protein